MIKIYVCNQCQSKSSCDFKDGIKLYDFIKSFIKVYLHEIDVEINVTSCKCLGICNGPVVMVNDKTYTNVNQKKALEIIKNIARNIGEYSKG